MIPAIPRIIEPIGRSRSLTDWVRENKNGIDAELDQYGAILLRGFDSTEAAFSECVEECGGALEYTYRSTPRTSLGNAIYTATEYSPGVTIPLHNENAYQRDWPMRLMLFCVQPADRGGETPLASTVAVTDKISPRIRDDFASRQVMYIRHYREDIDLPWTTVFQTNSKSEVEQYCRDHEIICEWVRPDVLRTKQVCPSFARHPRTGRTVWFNQAHLFHVSNLDAKNRRIIAEMFKEEEPPRNATYGDGTAISEADLDEVRQAFRGEKQEFRWRAGDFLILDNMLVSHGRNPYKGKRRVLAAMSHPYSGNAVRLHRPERAIG